MTTISYTSSSATQNGRGNRENLNGLLDCILYNETTDDFDRQL
jgi:hypothetical protein